VCWAARDLNEPEQEHSGEKGGEEHASSHYLLWPLWRSQSFAGPVVHRGGQAMTATSWLLPTVLAGPTISWTPPTALAGSGGSSVDKLIQDQVHDSTGPKSSSRTSASWLNKGWMHVDRNCFLLASVPSNHSRVLDDSVASLQRPRISPSHFMTVIFQSWFRCLFLLRHVGDGSHHHLAVVGEPLDVAWVRIK
jgi:hypothetical protein